MRKAKKKKRSIKNKTLQHKRTIRAHSRKKSTRSEKKIFHETDFQGHISTLKDTVDAAILTDLDGRVLFINKHAEELTGWSKKEGFGKPLETVFRVIHPRTRKSHKNLLQKVLWLKKAWGTEKNVVHISKNGTEREIIIRISLLRNSKGKILGTVTIFHDVTRERKAMEKVKENETRYNKLFEASTDAIFVETVSGRIMDCNATALIMYGYTRSEMLHLTVADLVPKEIALKLPDIIIDQLTQGGMFIEALGRRKNGEIFPTEVSTRLVTTGREQNVVVFVRDITEHKKIEQALEAASLYNRKLFEAHLDPLMTLDPDGRIADVNSAAELITGFTRDQLVGTNFSDYFTEPERAKAGYRWVFEEGTVRDYELHIKHKDGTITPVLYNASVYWDKSGKVIGVLAVARDITGIKKIETALKESEKKFRAITENTSSGIFIHQIGRLIYVNPAILQLLGYSQEEALKMYIWDIIHPDYTKMVKAQAQSRAEGDDSPKHYELRLVTKKKDVRWVEIYTNPIELSGEAAIIGTCFDITERKKNENALWNAHQQLLSIFDSINEVIYVIEPETYEVLYINQAGKNLLGDVTGRRCYECLQDLKAPCDFCANENIFGDNLGKTHIWEFQSKITKKWYHCIDKAIRWPDGRMVRYEMAINIEERKRIDAARQSFYEELKKKVRERTDDLTDMNKVLAEKQGQQQALLDSIPDIAWLKDRESRLIAVNHAYAEAAGVKADDLVGKTDLDIWPKDLAERYRADDRVVMASGTMKRVEEPLVDKDGNESWLETIKVPFFNDKGEVVGTAGIARDFSRRKSAEEILRQAQSELEKLIQERTEELAKANDILKKEIMDRQKAEETVKHLAYHDALTSLPNRILFDDRIGLALAQARRYKQKFAVMFLDLDRFKDINDRLGHNVGDMLLKAVSIRLTGLLRKIDTIARMGGDEFILLLTELKQEQDSMDIAVKVMHMFELPFLVNGYEINITASIGISVYPEDGEDPETLVQNADIAMYYAKEKGRNKYFRYSPQFNHKGLKERR